MRTLTTVTDVYQYEELSDKAKEKARDWYLDGQEFEFDFVIEDAKTIGLILGIEIDKVLFTGFSSQGDGACFEGTYKHKKDALKNIMEHAPKDLELHQIAKELEKLQSDNNFELSATVKQTDNRIFRYYHENATYIEVFKDTEEKWDYTETEKEVAELLRDFMKWIYKSLEAENDYQQSKEYVEENIKANEYEFTIEGKRV